MAGSINKVILVGNLGKDPEARSFQTGGKVVNLSVATSEVWTDRGSGERREKTQWHNVVIRNEKLGEVAEKYLHKGSKVYLEGTLQSRKYTDQSGQERYITEVIVGPFRSELVLLSGREDGETAAPARRPERSTPNYGGGSTNGAGASNQSWDNRGGGGGGAADLNDEIPFAPCVD